MTGRNQASDSTRAAERLPAPRVLVLRVAGILGFGLATMLLYYSILDARADWLSKERTRQSILAAIHLVPNNSLFFRFWAEIDPADSLIALRQAAVVNPLNADIRMELGLSAEKAGNLGEAEAILIKAVSLDRTGAPRGILAEYYFRHREADKFWPAARDALEHSYVATTTLFEDCWALSSDSRLILERAIPDRPNVLIDYLDFLVSRNRLDAAKPVSDRIMATYSGADAAKPMFNYCDRLVTNNSPSQAVIVWNWLCRRKFLPYATLGPETGHSLTNGGFTSPPLSTGFDWRLSPNRGLYIEQTKQPAALNLTFTGDQPEQCEILSQFVPLLPNRKYRLRVDYYTLGIDKDSGLIWRILLLPGNKDLLDNSGMLSGGSGEREYSESFVAPADATLGKLVLSYERVKGTVRINGSAEMRHVDLTFDQ